MGQDLSSFNFGGSLSPLQDTINLNPQMIQDALSQAQGVLQPQFKQMTRDVRNQAAAANQLGTSTFTDALANVQENLASQFQAIVSGTAIDSARQALQNRIGLLQTGIGASSTALGGSLNAQSQRNAFEQQRFENQLGLNAMNAKGGFVGGLTGALGGYLATGSPLGAIGGGLAGGFGSPGTGGQIAQIGGTLAGSKQNSGAGLQDLFNFGRQGAGKFAGAL